MKDQREACPKSNFAFPHWARKKCAESIPVLCLSLAGGQVTKQQLASADRGVSTALWSSHRHPQLAHLLLQHNQAKIISVINQSNVKAEHATTSNRKENLWEIFQSMHSKKRCTHGLGRWENTTLNVHVSAQITRRLSKCPKIKIKLLLWPMEKD